MSRAARSTFARFSLALAPLCASLFLGFGFGLACTSDAGSNCTPGTTNCDCLPGNGCYPGLQCLAGYCVAATGETGGDGDPGDGDGDNPCDNGQQFCGGKCVDTDSHILHCGGCDMPCASEELCHEGVCATDCSETACEGMTYCDPDTDLCLPGCEFDSQCGSNEMCDVANHECVCYEGYVLCAGECIWEGDPCADNCGNNTIDPGEACDGNDVAGYTCADFGYISGTLECFGDCSDFDTSNCTNVECGNGIVEEGEECDGVDLNGEDCMSQGFLGGTLSCTNCSFNTAGCNNDSDDGNCCVSHQGVGCEVPSVQQCVCALDAYCCNTQWDMACVNQAIADCDANCP